jgi:hypothetical protein
MSPPALRLGLLIGRSLRRHGETLHAPFAALQAALLGVVGLILAFGLSLAVGRYENRRATVVDEANSIGTTYLRAQTLKEPVRTRSLDRLRRYTDASIRVASLNNRVPAAVLALEVVGAALALGLLAVYLAIIGRGVLPVLLAAGLVSMLLLVTFDLDRPTRGLIRVPSTPLTDLRASMALPPAAAGPVQP